MSKKGSGLARLMGGLKALDGNADVLASRLENALADMTAEMATTTKIIGDVETSVDDLRSVNALYSNGDGVDESPTKAPGSGASSTGSQTSQPSSQNFERTAIGPVTR